MIWLPETDLMLRSSIVAVPVRIHVWPLPSRTRSSMCIRATQAGVTGRRMEMVSPTAKFTPATVVKLLRYMYASSAREQWISMLPVGG